MNSTRANGTTNVQSYNAVHYTAQAIANELGVSEATVRNRWFNWIVKVAPEALLKEGKGFTELARSLFAEFAQVPKQARQQWVVEAKAHYCQEWGSAGVIEGELVPDEVSGALALIQTQNSNLQQSLEVELADVQAFIEQANTAEVDFSEAELQAYKTAGAKRGIARFKLETQTELEVLNALRQQRMQGNAN
ncbi:hypothetical protein [Almyronema epifaneia]|uniref:DNA-binding protein n=1 Tax=Almyronema epifaneia S1 TaxID=2991925 RepID=A0ABW6IJS9_9CYAN